MSKSEREWPYVLVMLVLLALTLAGLYGLLSLSRKSPHPRDCNTITGRDFRGEDCLWRYRDRSDRYER